MLTFFSFQVAELKQRVSDIDTAEACERMAGIRVTAAEKEPSDEQYKFDYEKKTEPKPATDSNVTTVIVGYDEKDSNVDLLGLGNGKVPSVFFTLE